MKALLHPLVNGTLELAFNRFIQQDAERLKKMAPLQGKVLQLTVTGIVSVYMVFADDQLVLLQKYEGSADSHLSLSLNALGLLKDKSLLMQYIRDGRIDLQGDPMPWQDFSALVKDPSIDIEGWLATYTGDIAAHLLCRHAGELTAAITQRGISLRNQLSDYALEEARLAVGPLELADFNDDVGELYNQVSQLEVRLATLIDKVRHS
ncbi:ubiquinone biosynthesis accessory factor UbiJ [Oceanisphaera pacifica]|uniref:Ubiquinone biosynthesis accessory factor UbiJ n=1 Tax=Oceanisphaera pacifica TaxID=2818389 RepID=A0ABS3NHX4_9GAMM|nr:SCP2 sterol-binding domain-containing protein [Oceanisphaera pacifica]MBO1520176.1 SCP2 sterol-binding domain-containing protein [Oceanisphaera pacifica]